VELVVAEVVTEVRSCQLKPCTVKADDYAERIFVGEINMQFDKLVAGAEAVTERYLQPDSEGNTSGRVAIDPLSAADLDSLPFGAIQLDREGKILQYNDYESKLAGVEKSKAVGKNFFTELAPCTNVKEFQGKFKDGVAQEELHETFRYHFPFKQNPRDVVVTLFFSKMTETAWVFIRPA
jgi:photoactive yellow protein